MSGTKEIEIVTNANEDIQEEIAESIFLERRRQDGIWGYPRPDLLPTDWITVIGEEIGEASDEALSVRFNGTHQAELKKELVHAAAVIVAFLEHLALQTWPPAFQEDEA